MTIESGTPDTRTGVLLIVCAPSGTGKTTLTKLLREEFPAIKYSVSCTTRTPRQGEINGKDYIFLEKNSFLQQRTTGYFAESACVHGNWYGTPLEPLENMLRSGHDVLFDIDVQGAAQLRLALPRGRFVFLFPPSLKELGLRLNNRGTDTAEAIEKRLAIATTEMQAAHWFDAWIVNDDLQTAYAQLRAFYIAATLSPALRPQFVAQLTEGDHHG